MVTDDRLLEEQILKLVEQMADKDWRAAAWLLERQWPEKYEKGARKPAEDDSGADGVDELAKKRAARRAG